MVIDDKGRPAPGRFDTAGQGACAHHLGVERLVELPPDLPEHFDEVETTFCETAGHFVHVEAPDEAAQVLSEFFG